MHTSIWLPLLRPCLLSCIIAAYLPSVDFLLATILCLHGVGRTRPSSAEKRLVSGGRGSRRIQGRP